MSGPRLPDEPPPEQPGEEVQSENEVGMVHVPLNYCVWICINASSILIRTLLYHL
ncbi:hypothetical protein DEO72_LG2g4734 [Vigna unguiculata]|uniref:Uncharacterized protein n=1 Tax=Vigna unguiculata TaxID=3917 RepID=A0A4D6L794_VIGUN|nr:hypothetical protein DEO72_LG2g4734 [Vigna unguiculata]